MIFLVNLVEVGTTKCTMFRTGEILKATKQLPMFLQIFIFSVPEKLYKSIFLEILVKTKVHYLQQQLNTSWRKLNHWASQAFQQSNVVKLCPQHFTSRKKSFKRKGKCCFWRVFFFFFFFICRLNWKIFSVLEKLTFLQDVISCCWK